MDKYIVEKKIGQGSYGGVSIVREKTTQQRWVLKRIPLKNLSAKEKASAKQEVKLLQSFSHPNVVSYKESFLDNKDSDLCIIMTYCDGGDLASRVKSAGSKTFSEEFVLNVFIQIAFSLEYIHSRRILHRDLKLANIFLTKDGQIKLGDFGIAKELTKTMDLAKTAIGTPLYMSPEVCSSKPYSYKSDIWSLGCILYELLSLKHAFDAHDLNGLVMKIIRGKVPAIPPQYSVKLGELVQQMLAKEPKDRPDIRDILRRSWMRKHITSYVILRYEDAFFADDEGAARVREDIRRDILSLKKQFSELQIIIVRESSGGGAASSSAAAVEAPMRKMAIEATPAAVAPVPGANMNAIKKEYADLKEAKDRAALALEKLRFEREWRAKQAAERDARLKKMDVDQRDKESKVEREQRERLRRAEEFRAQQAVPPPAAGRGAAGQAAVNKPPAPVVSPSPLYSKATPAGALGLQLPGAKYGAPYAAAPAPSHPSHPSPRQPLGAAANRIIHGAGVMGANRSPMTPRQQQQPQPQSQHPTPSSNAKPLLSRDESEIRLDYLKQEREKEKQRVERERMLHADRDRQVLNEREKQLEREREELKQLQKQREALEAQVSKVERDIKSVAPQAQQQQQQAQPQPQQPQKTPMKLHVANPSRDRKYEYPSSISSNAPSSSPPPPVAPSALISAAAPHSDPAGRRIHPTAAAPKQQEYAIPIVPMFSDNSDIPRLPSIQSPPSAMAIARPGIGAVVVDSSFLSRENSRSSNDGSPTRSAEFPLSRKEQMMLEKQRKKQEEERRRLEELSAAAKNYHQDRIQAKQMEWHQYHHQTPAPAAPPSIGITRDESPSKHQQQQQQPQSHYLSPETLSKGRERSNSSPSLPSSSSARELQHAPAASYSSGFEVHTVDVDDFDPDELEQEEEKIREYERQLAKQTARISEFVSSIRQSYGPDADRIINDNSSSDGDDCLLPSESEYVRSGGGGHHNDEDEYFEYDEEEFEEEDEDEEAQTGPSTRAGRLSQRIEMLRQQCIAGLGKEIFDHAYAFLKRRNDMDMSIASSMDHQHHHDDNDALVKKELAAIVGRGNVDQAWNLLDQLLFCEETLSS